MIFLEIFYQSREILAIGFSKGIQFLLKDLVGTTEKKMMGGIIVDMLCHWRYVLDNIFGQVKGVFCLGATHISERIDENGKPYDCTADDAAYSIFELEGGIIAQFNSSWTTRVRRDDLLTLHVDGTKGSAVVGLRDCWIQDYDNTPKPVWNPDIPNPIDFKRDG